MKRLTFILISGLWLLATSFSPAIIDENANGLSDLWEKAQNNGDLLSSSFDPQADDDSDGWTNEQEAAAGTNPFDHNPPDGFLRPEITHIPALYGEENGQPVIITPETCSITWPVIPGKQYTLQFSIDLSSASWMPVGDPFIAEETVPTYYFPTAEADKCFWRVAVIDVDTDGDALSNAEEAELGTDPQDKDSDDDGLDDGQEITSGTNPNNTDSDQDGTPDIVDISPMDDTASFPLGIVPRYALFPITNAQPIAELPFPIQINDKGTVLYSNGTWKAGNWTPLSLDVSGSIENASARGINDSDTILGIGYDNAQSPYPDYFFDRLTCYWPSPTDQPLIVENSDSDLMRSHHLDTPELGGTVSPFDLSSGPMLSNDGGFYSKTHRLKADSSGWDFEHYSRWKLPSGGQSITETPASDFLRYSAGPGLQWGYDPARTNGSINAGGSVVTATTLPVLSFLPTNVIVQPGGTVIAMPSSDSTEIAQAYVQNVWKPCVTYAQALDISSDGTAIGKSSEGLDAPICLNGDWNKIYQAAPFPPLPWKDSTVTLKDTTAGGWILARRGSDSANDPLQSAVMLPIRVDGVDPDLVPPPLPPAPGAPPYDPPEFVSGGVDHTSMTALAGSGKLPQIWIMAPNGGESNTVRFRSPLNETSTLQLSQGQSGNSAVAFNPDTVASDDIRLNVSGLKTNSQDVHLDLKLVGSLESTSIPVMVKTMKKRLVKVAVHQVIGLDADGDPTVPENMPSEADMEDALNRVYGRQVNTFFDVTQHVEINTALGGIPYDKYPYKVIDVVLNPDETQDATPNAKSDGENPSANIDVWVLSGVSVRSEGSVALGVHHGGPGIGKIIIDGELNQKVPSWGEEWNALWLHVLCHEIGHVFTGDGHPNYGEGDCVLKWRHNGPAVSTDTRDQARLMCSGDALTEGNLGKQLIKTEWDLIEAWLKKQEDDGKL